MKGNIKEAEKAMKEEVVEQNARAFGGQPFEEDDYEWVIEKLESISEYEKEGRMPKQCAKKPIFLRIREEMEKAKKEGRNWIPKEVWDELEEK